VEDCPNYAYPIKHKLKDCGIMKSFMSLGSLTRGMELGEVSDEGDMTPFPREDAIMTIYDGCPPLGMCRVSNLNPGTPARYGWGCGDAGM
jgi:hypothetical protein